MKEWGNKKTGFTIVELLIVVVVIAILAAITIVGYNGIQQSSRSAGLQSTVSQLAKRLETFKTSSSSETYPTSLSAANIAQPSNVTYSVSVSNRAFCVVGIDGALSFYATSFQLKPTQGSCNTADGLVGWWRFNGDAADSNGATTNATVNGQSLSVGQNGQAAGAYTFSGSNGMTHAASELPVGAAARTVLAWVYPTSYPATGWQMVHGYGATGTAGASALSISTAGRLTFNGQSNDFVSPTVLPLNTWSFVGYTLSGNQVATVYNGVSTSSTLTTTSATTSAATAYIGAYVGGGNRWVGAIDDLRIYNRILSASELQAAYAAGAL